MWRCELVWDSRDIPHKLTSVWAQDSCLVIFA